MVQQSNKNIVMKFCKYAPLYLKTLGLNNTEYVVNV